jgi:uncharacterized YigZ family protein
MIRDSYLTIALPAKGEYKEKGSKFIAYSFPLNADTELEGIIESIKNEHPKARHYCYAYRIGTDMNKFRTNDDGEPSGTAGKPILGQIQSFNLTNVLVVVVRYFGGTKLGASGLINAYKSATKEALDNSSEIEKYIKASYILHFNYDQMGHILSVIKDNNIDITQKSFDEECQITIEMRLSEVKEKILKLKAGILGISTDEAEAIAEIPYCKIQKS